ncbi:MAG: orotate phosphoribosyltransferase [Desulfovibrio sp.]|jgi:orotate phosphoribosyltransferase|nr:orotate phosphoribosyltransferase [Desulfovibrio sp.]
MSPSEICGTDVHALKVRLAGILCEKSYMEGDFTLSSGRKSEYYFDCRQTSLHPEGAWLIGSIFVYMLRGVDVQAVAGMTMGADPLVTATSMVARGEGMYLPALIVRKEPKGHGAGRTVEGLANVPRGSGVVMLEDVVSTGGSVLKACRQVEAAGLRVLSVMCILNRREPGCAEAFAGEGRHLQAMYTREDLLSLAGGAGSPA